MDHPFLRPFRYGWKVLLPLGLLALGVSRWSPRLAVLLANLTGLVALTFRDPDREIQRNPELALAPADGRVMRVETVFDDYWQQEMREVAIFLAIWDVHIQRTPADGHVVGQTRKHGANRPAMTNAAAMLNNQILTYYDTPRGPMTVNQITGIVARRLVNWNPVGTSVKQGERMGMIVLGSQVTLRVRLDAEIVVQSGDVVRAGLTPLARID
jgi:phosphatidylserine decarboxylase